MPIEKRAEKNVSITRQFNVNLLQLYTKIIIEFLILFVLFSSHAAIPIY
jgi:hypothetical protein